VPKERGKANLKIGREGVSLTAKKKEEYLSFASYSTYLYIPFPI